MKQTSSKRSPWRGCLYAALLAAGAASAGCQVDYSGQTLPSGYWMDDDVRYSPPGAEFQQHREAAQQKAYRAEQELQNAARKGPARS